MAASGAWVQSTANTGKRGVRRVLIVDDHPIVRQGLRRIMENEEDVLVCGEAETSRDARIAIKELNPDVMIADISLKQSDGIELVRDVRAHYPHLPILVLSMHDEAIYAERILSAGANGYIMKQAASEQFLIALRRVLDGGIYVSEAVGNNMIQKFASGGSYVSANPIDRLSNRELQILHMIGKGMSTRETAESLNLSIKTVESHRQRIKRKLNLNTGTQLVQYAVNWLPAAGTTATPRHRMIRVVSPKIAEALLMCWEPQQFTQRLLDWFTQHGRRNLPWQMSPTPYRVWVSEVMLQQTQVATVIPYYTRFMLRFPNIESLASACLDEVLHLWTGLGYYARARNLHACAQTVVAQYGGEFPEHIDALIGLPGIGRSTAGAILALACGQRQPILDGNAKRVLARVFGIGENPTSSVVNTALWAQADACTPRSEVAAYTQAIMDLGATVCTRSRPDCPQCPMNAGCVAALEGRQAELPGKKPKVNRASREMTLLIAQTGSNGSTAVLLERRPASGVWGGLWSPPQFKSAPEALQWCLREIGDAAEPHMLPPIYHAFTHFDLRLNPVQVLCRPHSTIREADDRLWYSLDAPPRVGLPQPIRELLARLHAASGA